MTVYETPETSRYAIAGVTPVCSLCAHRPLNVGLVERQTERGTSFEVQHYHAKGVLPWSNGHIVVPKDLYQCVCDMVSMPKTNSLPRLREVSRPT